VYPEDAMADRAPGCRFAANLTGEDASATQPRRVSGGARSRCESQPRSRGLPLAGGLMPWRRSPVNGAGRKMAARFGQPGMNAGPNRRRAMNGPRPRRCRKVGPRLRPGQMRSETSQARIPSARQIALGAERAPRGLGGAYCGEPHSRGFPRQAGLSPGGDCSSCEGFFAVRAAGERTTRLIAKQLTLRHESDLVLAKVLRELMEVTASASGSCNRQEEKDRKRVDC
jgi:hypothetical protein